MAQNIDQCMNDFLQRIMKEMQLLMGERYPLYFNCNWIENLLYLFENRCLITLEGGETPMAYCSASIESLRFDQCLGPFSVIWQPWNFYKVESTNTPSGGRTTRKITKIL